MQRTELFKMDANNRVRIWIIWVEHLNTSSIVHIRQGLNGGTLAHSNTPFSTFNHITKSEAFAESRINYMRDRRGYTADIPISKPFRPMLLQRYKDRKDSLPPRLHVQPKLNGIRCLASKYWLRTRTNDIISSCPHVLACLQDLPDDVVLDGELYNHYLSLQEISGAVRTHIPTPISAQLSFWVFDLVEESLTFSDRWPLLLEHLSFLPIKTPTEPHLLSRAASQEGSVHVLNTLYMDESEIESHYQYFLSNKYEGAVIRNPRSHYQINTRSPGVLKHKPIQTMNVKIIDILPCDRAPKQGKFLLQNPKGGVFSCNFKAPHVVRERILQQKSRYIGQLCAVEYEDFSNDDKPLKPIAIRICGVKSYW